MVFGMFMAILDLQIVSSSLSEFPAGLSSSSVDFFFQAEDCIRDIGVTGVQTCALPISPSPSSKPPPAKTAASQKIRPGSSNLKSKDQSSPACPNSPAPSAARWPPSTSKCNLDQMA